MILALFALLCTSPAPQTPEAPEEDLARVAELREVDPEDPEFLAEYATLLGSLGDEDGELAYLLYALEAFEAVEADDEKAKAKRIKALELRVKRLDASVSRLRGKRDDYLDDLVWVMRLYANNQKKPRNALDVAGRILRHRPAHRLARATVEKILKDADRALQLEADRLLGLRELQRPRSYRLQWARDHQSWQSAGRVETRGYSVHSNIGYDTLHRSAGALERISEFYRDFYGTDTGNQKGRTLVSLYRTRDEFESYSAKTDLTANPGIRGFLSPSIMKRTHSDGREELEMKFKLYSYDPRDDGSSLESLYSTLFHEASHQYMRLATGWNDAPDWLDEGMACYFEGVKLGAGGEVRVGLPAMPRLRYLVWFLTQEKRPLVATLSSPDLDGAQYAVAWGLIYYFHHYQLEDGSHPYRPLLRRAIQRVGGGMTDGMQLFKAVCLSAVGHSFEEFESRWVAAMNELLVLESDPAAAAEHHRNRAERFLAEGNVAAAREAFCDALLRAPGDGSCLLGLARLKKGSKERDDKDDTLLWARRAHGAAVEATQPALEKKALELADASDPAGFEKVLKAERNYRKKILFQVHRHIEQGRPRTGLAIVLCYLDHVLGENHFDTLSEELRAKGDLDLQRTLKVFDGKSLAGLSASPSIFHVAERQLIAEAPRAVRAPLSVTEPVAARMRFEGEIQVGSCDTIVSFLISPASGGADSRGFTVRPQTQKDCQARKHRSYYPPFEAMRHGQIGNLREAFLRDRKRFDFVIEDPRPNPQPLVAKKWISFALDTTEPGVLRLELDGKEVARREMPSDGSELRPGAMVTSGEMRLRGLRVVEWDRP